MVTNFSALLSNFKNMSYFSLPYIIIEEYEEEALQFEYIYISLYPVSILKRQPGRLSLLTTEFVHVLAQEFQLSITFGIKEHNYLQIFVQNTEKCMDRIGCAKKNKKTE